MADAACTLVGTTMDIDYYVKTFDSICEIIATEYEALLGVYNSFEEKTLYEGEYLDDVLTLLTSYMNHFYKLGTLYQACSDYAMYYHTKFLEIDATYAKQFEGN